MTRSVDKQVIGHVPALQRYARSLLRDDEAAQDLVHDTLVLALANAAQFHPGRPLRPWLFSILHNCFLSASRKSEVRSKHRTALAAMAEAIQPPDQEANIRLLEVQRSLLELSEDQRAALHLVGVEGLSYQEAASVLSVPVGTLISRISRARARLREIEKNEFGEPASAKLRIVKD